MYLRNSQARRDLPIPAGPMTLTRRGRPSRVGGVVEVLELAELLVATDERRLERLGPADAAALGDDPDRAPGGHRALLALEDLVGRRLEDDRAAGRALGRLADEDGRRRRRALEPARRVDHVAGDHPLAGRAEGDRRLAGQDPDPDLDPWAERPDRVDEVQPGADRPLGVVLVGDRGAPQRHHRVADELLDRRRRSGR